jgi:hypothetical protein
MIRSAIRTKIENRLVLPTAGDPRLTSSVLNGLIDEAIRYICMERDWPWLLTSGSLTLTSGTAALPSRFMKARRLVVNERRARFVPLDEFLDASRSTPVWTIIGTNVQILPVPTAALTGTLYYYASEADLASDSASPVMPEIYQDAIVAYASHLASLVRQDDRRAADNLGLYEVALRKMPSAISQRTGPRRVRLQSEDSDLWATWT